MSNNNNKTDDRDMMTDIIGIQRTHRVLQIGEKKMSFLKKYVNEEVCFVDNMSGLSSEFIKHRVFDRIIVNTDISINDFSVLANMNVGLIVAFFIDDDEKEKMCDFVDAHWYPDVEVWQMEFNGLGCMMTNATGCIRTSAMVAA